MQWGLNEIAVILQTIVFKCKVTMKNLLLVCFSLNLAFREQIVNKSTVENQTDVVQLKPITWIMVDQFADLCTSISLYMLSPHCHACFLVTFLRISYWTMTM